MGKFKNYLLATAGLIILGGVVQYVRPLQAAPPVKDVNVINTPLSVVVENGDGNDTMVITLVDDMAISGIGFDLDPVDVSGFRFVSFHGMTEAGRGAQFRFRFSTQEGKFSDDIIKASVSRDCGISDEGAGGSECHLHGIAGPFLLVQVDDTNTFDITLQAFLSNREANG